MHEHALITGGCGFVGSFLAMALREAGLCRNVTALDNLHRRGSELNLARLKRAGVGFVHGDIRCAEDLAPFAGATDLVVECSAEPSAQAGYGSSPEYLIQSNLTGCFHCLEIARRSKADFLFLSTSRVYPYRLLNSLSFEETDTRFRLTARQELPGASEHGVSERFPLDGARSLYGMTKLAAELMIQEYADAYGLRAVINRCGLLTGPWQMGKTDQGVIVLWMAAHYFRRGLRYIGFEGTGKQVRDFLHIADLADLVLAQVREMESYRGRVFNVGGGVPGSLSLRECTELCREITGNAISIAPVAENRPADVRIYVTDHRAVSAAAGWAPRRDARRTLADIYQWIQSEESAVERVLLGSLC
jgi:CDP-paratose 2-epimerase